MRKILFVILLISIGPIQAQNLFLQYQLPTQKFPASTTASFFVKGDEKQIRQYLKTIRGTYKYSFRGYHHISLPAEKINKLSQQPFITTIDYHHQVPTVLNDSMRVKARVNQVHQGLAPLPQGYTGKGIVIGLIDDGIDFNHPDFQDSGGRTRVLAIWDQTQGFDAARTPGLYGYGQVWDSTDINSGICTSTETSGHGTTVSGTAAGNGFSTGTHQGVAPDCWIVMVKSNFSMPNWSATVADAADFIYRLADSLELPCSINASVGDYYGPHDGTDLPSQYIDSLIKDKRGRLFSAALGNSGTFPPYHLRNNVTADTSFTWFKYNPPGGPAAFPYGVVFFEAFADTADMQNVFFSVGADQVSPVYKHRGQSTFRNAFDFLNTTLTDTIWSNGGNVLGIVDYYSEILNGGILSLQVHLKQPDSSMYYFRFSATGSGAYDIWSAEWLGISDMINTVPSVTVFPDLVHYVSPDSAKTMVNGPQCLESVITVANYNNIQNYIGYDGNPVSLGEIEGDICSTSSRGPTRDNRQKPDVAATGNVTFSPGPLPILSTLISVAPSKLLPDGMHMRNGGTSMASPVVAGIGALLLERCPQMSWQEFKTHLNTSAYSDGHTGTVPNISFGHGKVSAYDAVVHTLYTPVLTGDTAMCAGDLAEFLAPVGYQQYLWSNGDTTYASSLDTSGQVWFVGVDIAGCRTDTATISVNEHPLPVVSLSQSGGTLTAHTSGTYIYQWYHNGSALSGENDSTYTPLSDGSYYATASDGLCTGYSDTTFITGIPVQETGAISIYPNPFGDELNIVSSEMVKAEIRNNLGELVAVSHSNKIYTRHWPQGIYFVRITGKGSPQVFKLVKQ